MSKSKYTVRPTNEFTSTTSAPSRTTAGVTIPVEGATLELTPTQVDEIVRDRYLTISDAQGNAVEATTATPETPETDVNKMSFAELKDHAGSVGVENPTGLKSKADAISAITAAQNSAVEVPVTTPETTDTDPAEATPAPQVELTTTQVTDDAPAAPTDATE